ncbi:MAG TPA: hypothetical protein VF139_10100 [Candidatus Polarisedimenticolaceae bacterium]
MKRVPEIRVRAANAAPARPDRAFVLYWMIAARRSRRNFALQRAVEHAVTLGRPIVVLEALRTGYRWASERLHRFVLDGMADNADAFARRPVLYHPFVERTEGSGSGLVETLARDAAVVVTDEFPCFFLPRMVERTAARLDVLLETVDSNGLLPLRAASQVYPTAYAFRRFLQKTLPDHLDAFPDEDPLEGIDLPRLARLPEAVVRRWPEGATADAASLPEEAHVPPAPFRGGARAGAAALQAFLDLRLPRYVEARNRPEEEVTSGLSPYLHFGHVSIHDVFTRLASREAWFPGRLSKVAKGERAGWWGMGPEAESFLDEAITWREVGYNFAHLRPSDHDRFESLPEWAKRSLLAHAGDAREPLYRLDRFESAATHDPLWNAAQTQLVREGRMHNYLRMLWGKKILQWAESPQQAAEILVHLNNKYALDGRNPNSYSGIFWVLGRYDRPWGPERPVFGTVRYMSSENTARKVPVKAYLKRYVPAEPRGLFS